MGAVENIKKVEFFFHRLRNMRPLRPLTLPDRGIRGGGPSTGSELARQLSALTDSSFSVYFSAYDAV